MLISKTPSLFIYPFVPTGECLCAMVYGGFSKVVLLGGAYADHIEIIPKVKNIKFYKYRLAPLRKRQLRQNSTYTKIKIFL